MLLCCNFVSIVGGGYGEVLDWRNKKHMYRVSQKKGGIRKLGLKSKKFVRKKFLE